MSEAYPIGTVFKRRVPLNDALDEIRVVGGGNALVVTSNTEFGARLQIPLKDLFAEYLDEHGSELQEPEIGGRMISPAEFFENETRKQRQAEAAETPIVKAQPGGRRAAKPSN